MNGEYTKHMITVFPDPYPDELLYSVCARYGDRMCYPSRMSLTAELFGNPNVVATLDLPSHLNRLVSVLPYGDQQLVDNIIDRHTLLPFYAPFLNRDRACQLRTDMCDTKAVSTHMRAGIMASKITLPPSVRYCPQCVVEDRAHYGETFWHRAHQLPGVPICPIHSADLVDSTVQVRRQESRLDYYSAERTLEEIGTPSYCIASRNKMVWKVAKDAQWLLEQPNLLPEVSQLRKQYLKSLISQGHVAHSGRIRIQSLLPAFSSFCQPDVLELLQCSMNNKSSENWLVHLLRPLQYRAQHPIRYLLLIRFLGSSVEEFARLCCESAENHPFGSAPWPCLNPTSDHYRQSIVTQCETTYTHELLARPIGTFCCECGYVYARTGPDELESDKYRFDRVVAYGEVWEERLASYWQDQRKSLRAVARGLHVDPLTVKRHAIKLRLPYPRGTGNESVATHYPSQVNSREDVKAQILKIENYRAKWLNALALHPGWSTSTVGRVVPGIYAWLSKNDRAWLAAHRPGTQREALAPRMQASWAERDHVIAEAVAAAAQKIRSYPGRPVQITLTSLGRESGYSVIIFRHGNKLPLTMSAIQAVVESREAYGVRRIQWAAERCRDEGVMLPRWKFVKLAGVARIALEPAISSVLDLVLGPVTVGAKEGVSSSSLSQCNNEA